MSYTKSIKEGSSHTQMLHSGDKATVTGSGADVEIIDPGMLVGTTNVFKAETISTETIYGPYTKSVTIRVRATVDGVTFTFNDTLRSLVEAAYEDA